jgi:AraC family transcriptional regulator
MSMRLATGEFFGKTDRRIGLDGVSISTTSYEPLEQQPWHTHEHATFFAHLAGGQVDERSDAEWSMPRLAIIYHPTSSPHRSRIGPTGAKGVNVELTERWLNENGIDLKSLGEHRISDSSDAQSSALRLIRAYSSAVLTDAEISDVALEMVEGFLQQPQALHSSRPRWLARTEEQIGLRFREPIGLTVLAREVGVHPVHLARVFRHWNSCSITDRLQRLRLHAAVDQILGGESVGAAAIDAGFTDQFYFSRVLKAKFGFCPKLAKQLSRPCGDPS